ncbi:MAG: metalloregulator ArsR/SmtB family transcription factor [Saprospiraceae bacterium]|nr:metalloregulator ArsR/SmtB family transcription factor [Saprospiraceae bacterium]
MAKQKIDLEKFENLAGKLKLMKHPMRIAIIELLDERPMNVTEIYTHFQIFQASASHHLNILKNHGLITKRADGKSMMYSVRKNALKQMVECIEGLQLEK